MTNRNKATFDFDVCDLPMIAAALRTASCEALMESRPEARRRLDKYRAAIDQVIPAEARIFDGMVWSEICAALGEAAAYSIHFEEWGYDFKKDEPARTGAYGRIVVSVDQKAWSSADYKHFKSGGTIEAVRAILHDIAPFGAQRVDVEDTQAGHRRPRNAPPAAAQPTPASRFDDDYGDNDVGYGP